MGFSQLLPLESRLLCSTTPVVHEEPKPSPTPTPVDPAVLESDRAVIATAVATLRTDYTTNMAALTAARNTRTAHAAALAAQIKQLTCVVTADQKVVSGMGAATEAKIKALRAKWAPIIGPEELDVKTNSPGETEEERAADAAKLAADRAVAMAELQALNDQAKADRAAATAKLQTDQAAVATAKKAGEMQTKADAAAVSLAEKTLKTVFQSDRKILDADLALYRKHGGKVDALHLPVLPRV